MSTRASRRLLRAAAVAVVALLLPACAGLPTSGDVAVGLELGESPDDVDVLPVASGPVAGAGPEEIVEGFLEAGITTSDNWATAREFLAPSLQRSWRPSAGVSIDAGAEARTLTSNLADDQVEDAEEAEVEVLLELVASVDDSGEYNGAPGDSSVPFALARDEDGEWRITQAPDGVVIDEARFPNVFEGYSLQWFDAGWSRLVPDMRWFPRRQSPATTVTQALVSGTPADWLDAAVQTAFPADVQLAQDAVLITAQVAEVALTRPAAGLDKTTLARMRTQLKATLKTAGVNVTEVRFSVDGRALDAGVVELSGTTAEPGTLVLKGGAFGRIVGDEIASIPAISAQIQAVPQPIAAIDVATDDATAALQLGDGHVYLVGEETLDELDARPGLVQPSIDPYGYVWSVPAGEPQAVQAIGADVVAHTIATAWPSASSISDLRVAADGARVAAVILVGGQRWVVVASVVRDGSGVPTELGEVRQLVQLSEPSTGLVWLGPDRLAVLTDSATPRLIVQPVGGPGSAETAPSDASAVAGARTPAGVRILDASGRLFAHAGSAWREISEGVSVLATRAGE
ncbi:LpqB family beta-propeller domain-containing protein [Microbacterium sp. p3-SID338]|uniref:LpqB family beta-propeller domain-containing protein n=1 Tax=Microbacterium sp. p3-SID338 TaxID=2916214 RepID=UPI0021A7E581|nr:LpqB family beta-propeller domain-containing protein [Microbacterium sp. p3-SID338]MCT1395274.1 LpqB family beta-propeller domain-containing protein [Microbacterium sp. p3-SID338]